MIDDATRLVQTAHRRQLALRLEVSALEAALAAGYDTPRGQYAYALTWLAEYAAERLMLKDAASAPAGLSPPYTSVPRNLKDAASNPAAGPATPQPPDSPSETGPNPRASRK